MTQKKYIIRSSVLNMDSEKWRRFHGNYADGPYEGTAWNFLRVIGLPSGKSAKYDGEEKAFFEEIYQLWREYEPSVNVKTFGIDY
jgi:hypothetical protein